MGGNIFSNIRRVEYPDFTGDRAKYEALQHAELQRKLQTQQALQQQAKFAHEQEGWQRDKDWQSILDNNPLIDPETGRLHPKTLAAMARANPQRTFEISKNFDDSIAAKFKADAAKQAQLEKDQQIALHDIDAGMKIADPQERLTYVMQNWERYRAINALTADEHEELARTGLTVPLHDRMATRLLGADKFGEYQKKALELTEAQRKAKVEAAREPYETQEIIDKSEVGRIKRIAVDLFNSKSKEEWDQKIDQLPERERAVWRTKEFTPTNRYQALAMGQTAAELAAQAQRAEPDSLDKIEMQLADPTLPQETRQRLEAARKGMIDWRNQVKPRIEGDTSGQLATILANPSLYHQLDKEGKAKLMAPLAAAGFTQWEPPPPEAYRQKLSAVSATRAALEQYRKNLNSYDPLVRPGTPEHAALESAFTGLQLKAKDAAGLGALAGPDMGILNKWITPPTSFGGRYSGKETLKKQLDEYETQLDASENALRGTYNQPLRKPGEAATQPETKAQPKNAEEAKAAGYVSVKDPQGKTKWFPSQAEADRARLKWATAGGH